MRQGKELLLKARQEKAKRLKANEPLEFIYNEAFLPALESQSRDLFLYGAANSGKSHFTAQKAIKKCVDFPKRRYVIVRRFGTSLKRTCWPLILELIEEKEIPCRINKTDLTIRFDNGSEMWFIPVVTTGESGGGEAASRLKSLTDVTDIWFEEPTELSKEEYTQIRRRMRGGDLTGTYPQRIHTLNPIDINHWLKTDYFDKCKGEWQKYGYRDNAYISEQEIADLEELKESNYREYQVYALGEWGVLKDIIYNNWEVQEFDWKLDNLDDVIAGVDFGFEHPSAWLLMGIKEKTVYITDEIYERKKTNPELIDLIKEKEDYYSVHPPTYPDTAEPARIEEMEQNGILVYPANKTIIEGLSVVQSYKLIIHPRCVNTIKEIQGYRRREDRQGNILEEPVKFRDHAMDAMRYGLATHRRSMNVEDVYPVEYDYDDEFTSEGKY